MAETIKVLGQSNPSATTLTDVYTVPALKSTVVSTITVCEKGGATATYRISVAVTGAADTAKQYVVHDTALAANETKTYTLGITLAATDVIRVYASTANVAFNIFGAESS
jgi:hypothetical protein